MLARNRCRKRRSRPYTAKRGDAQQHAADGAHPLRGQLFLESHSTDDQGAEHADCPLYGFVQADRTCSSAINCAP